MRRTNGHSKKAENHEHALSAYFMNYNFCRIHETMRMLDIPGPHGDTTFRFRADIEVSSWERIFPCGVP